MLSLSSILLLPARRTLKTCAILPKNRVKDQIAKILGVAQITVTGGHEREIQIHLHKKELDGIGQSINSVASIISAQTANIPGGHISSDHTEYTVRVLGEFKNLDEISQIRISGSQNNGFTEYAN